MAARPAAITTIANPVQIHTYATMIDGSHESWPQPGEPGEGLMEVRRGQTELVLALAPDPKMREPSHRGPVEAVARRPHRPATASTSTPGKPRLGRIDDVRPSHRLPVVKSTHTVPAMAALGSFGSAAAAVVAAGGIRVRRGSRPGRARAVSPGCERMRSSRSPASSGCSCILVGGPSARIARRAAGRCPTTPRGGRVREAEAPDPPRRSAAR